MKRKISILMIVTLLFTGVLSLSNQSYATTTYTTYETVTKYHLDIGAQHIWGNGDSKESATYQNADEGFYYGGTINVSAPLTFNEELSNVKAYPLSSSDFDWSEASSTDTSATYTYNGTDYLYNEKSYEESYKPYASTSITVAEPSCDGNTVTISYSALLDSEKDYDLKEMLKADCLEEILNLLGGRDVVEDSYPDMLAKLEDGADNGVGSSVWGFMYFIPIVIQYDVTEAVVHTISGFQPYLDVPTSAKAGEEYTVTDTTEFENEAEFAESELSYRVDGGSSVEVDDWPGTLGCEIDQTFDDVCTVEYTLTVWNIYGESKTATESINITDDREITVNADLTLPEYTYEGHTELAKDESTFTVDGVDYSATRAYAEDIASNSFKCDSSTVSIDKLTDIKANATFKEKGTYSVNLKIKTVTGGSAADTESIEVIKTPCIVDTLSGFQKQNRKQILTATVATYPGKPLTDYSITLKDKVTGDSVTLTPDHPQVNNSTIKTRSVTMTQDVEEGFAYITVEFLTKTPAYNSEDTDYSQQFYYEINVEDSKGDTDLASKYFDVTPDIPPTAAISLDSAFLRNEGTNTASITAEDVTVATDGDDVARTWYYGATTSPSVFTNVSTMDGYEKQSFGTDKIVGFNKVGVGKFTTKLFVKEVWTESTLEEYVTSSDYLTGTAISYSDVLNVAPVVSLELLNSTEQEILLLAKSDAEYQTLLNGKTALQQALLANCIDGQIIIKKLIGDTPSSVTSVQKQLSYTFSTGTDLFNDDTYFPITADSERSYLLTYTIVNSAVSVPKTIHAYSPYSGEVWSYTTSRNEDFTFGHDDTGKYLYLIYAKSNQTVMLDKRTGAVAGTIDIALTDKVWLSDNLAFIVKSENLYAIDLNSLTKTLVEEDIGAVSRVNGKLEYIAKTDEAIVKCILDMETLDKTKTTIVTTNNNLSSPDDYDAVCIDSTGKTVLWKNNIVGTDTFEGLRVYSAENDLIKEIGVGFSSDYVIDCFYTLDENGECNHVMVWGTNESTKPDSHDLIAVNLNTGATSSYGSKTDSLVSKSFSASFESNGKSYFYYPGWYHRTESGYYGPAYIFTFSGSTLKAANTGVGMIGSYDESIKASDRIVTSIFGNNKTGILQMIISAFPKTLAEETTEIVARFTNKLTFIGDVNTTADEITATAEAAKPATKIAATQDGYISLYNQTLDQNKKYYYDYEIKPLTSGTESKLTGLSAATATKAVNTSQSFLSDTYYVKNTYYEDFNDDNANKFFTLGGGVETYYGAYGGNSDDDGSTTESLTFTVPAGEKAIMSYDYFYSGDWSGVSNIDFGVFIDGERAYVDYASKDYNYSYTNGTPKFHYTHYKILSEGSHTVTINADSRYLIDNLKVETLSRTKPTLSTSLSTQEGDNEGWLDVEGSFETPNGNISYGSQASTYYSGGISYEITDYFQPKKYKTKYPRTSAYYQTVPSGYLQMGFAYPVGSYNYYDGDQLVFCIAGYTYDMGYRGDIGSGDKIFLKTKSEGTYTHTTKNDDKGNSSTIPTFDLITYPSNEVTLTGNISFDDGFTRYYFPKESSTGTTNLSIYIPKGEYLIKNLKLYYIENGQKIYVQNEDLEELTDLSNWTLSSGLTSSIVTDEEEEVDDEYVKVYKKGEKVLYNIYYSDYEEDPSKTGYWVYTHVNWPPDTVHPDAGKVLTAPIDRFYLSGKYTVTHWEVDNTQRTGTVGDASSYDAASNKVTMTFYVDGEGKVPWVEYIKTNPSSVKENNYYNIRVGVDDTEKDTLALETEVYLNGTLIKTDNKVGLVADSNGDYPEQTITGLSTAKVGVYQIICTVSDYSGTGIKSYKFTVTSEGKITGAVNHTDEWDANRKKYNLERFEEEINRSLLFNDYTAMTAPRKRGNNVFWSGEKFILRAETEGEPSKVTANIMTMDSKGNYISTGYSAQLSSTGKKTTSGAELWEGSLWDNSMINKWGRENPEQLFFKFTAYYSGGLTKTYIVSVIIDSDVDYWQLHRLW